MLGYDLAHWATFFAAAFLLNVSPGPDIAFILGHTARGGRRQGLAAMFGLWAGAFCHVLFAAIGLSAIVATSAAAFSVVKWAGVAYLAFLQESILPRQAEWKSDERALLLAAYNAGPGRLRRSGFDLDRMPAQTQDYVERASALHDVYLGELAAADFAPRPAAAL